MNHNDSSQLKCPIGNLNKTYEFKELALENINDRIDEEVNKNPKDEKLLSMLRQKKERIENEITELHKIREHVLQEYEKECNVRDTIKETHNYEPSDPPFFKLTTKNERIIYILGSAHTSNPTVLLPEAVNHFIMELSPNGILFIEHPATLFDICIKNLDKAFQKDDPSQDTYHKQFNPGNESWLSLERKSIWNNIKNLQIPGTRYKVENITILPFKESTFCLYTLEKKLKPEKYISGFETAFTRLKWYGDIHYLEDIQEAMDIMGGTEEKLERLFKGNLSSFNQWINNNPDPIEMSRNANTKYMEGYKYQNNEMGDEEDRKRNLKWAERIKDYLSQTANNSNIINRPILIVCGSGHLKGSVYGYDSFVDYLMVSGEFQLIERMDKSGEWKYIRRLSKNNVWQEYMEFKKHPELNGWKDIIKKGENKKGVWLENGVWFSRTEKGALFKLENDEISKVNNNS